MNLNYPLLYYSSLLNIIENLYNTFSNVKNVFQCYFPHRFQQEFTTDFLNKCAALDLDHLTVDKQVYFQSSEIAWSKVQTAFQLEITGIETANFAFLVNSIKNNYWNSYINSINLDELNLLYSQMTHYYHKLKGDCNDQTSLDLLESDISRSLIIVNNAFSSALSTIKKNYNTFISQHFYLS